MPFKSVAQQRFMHAAMGRGGIPKKTVDDFDEATNFSNLPKKKSDPQKALRARAMRMK